MPGNQPTPLGPWSGGMHNSSLSGEFIDDKELFDLVNLEVDTNDSLVNRPAISELTYTLAGSKSGCRILGAFLPSDGRRFLVLMTAGVVRLMDLSTNTITISSSTSGLTNACVVQYRNRLYVSPGPTDTAGNGGYFEALPSTAPTWSTIAAVPSGGALFVYKERIWSTAGADSTVNVSRLKWSNIADGNTWGGSSFTDVPSSTGEKLVDGLVLGNDIVLFMQHSTWRFTYETDVTKAQNVQVSSEVGVPAAHCAVMHANGSVYILHGNAVHEMYNFNFNKISRNVDMAQLVDPLMYSDMTYGLSIHRDRLLARYYSNLYCYSLLTGTWSRWDTTHKISRVTVIPSSAVGLDLAFAAAATSDNDGKLYTFKDSRTDQVGTGETFDCYFTTKTYDFDAVFEYKRIWAWSLTIATSGNTTIEAHLPNTGSDPSWDSEEDDTWDELEANNVLWDGAPEIIHSNVIAPDKGDYARKFYSMGPGFRFIRVYFIVRTTTLANNVEDSAVRVFDMSVNIRAAEHVTEQVN